MEKKPDSDTISNPLNIPKDLSDDWIFDWAQGCMLGALCGDALGAKFEFSPKPTKEQITEGWKMPGGGCHKIGSGQITDDGELAMCLGHGLVTGKGKLNLNKIAIYYGKWMESKPFDIGNTCRNSLPKAVGMKEHQAEMVRRGARNSEGSESNGSLMRLTPMCIWCHRLKDKDLEKAIEEETRLTHPNPVVADANIIYTIAIRHLLFNKGDNIGAYEAAKNKAFERKSITIQKWFKNIEINNLPDVDKKKGWVCIAFSYAFYYLKNGIEYKNALSDILSKGGDTDTNCCIIGGLLGAWKGISTIPKNCVEKLLGFDMTRHDNGGKIRPEFLCPKFHALEIIKTLINIAPKELILVGSTDEYAKSK